MLNLVWIVIDILLVLFVASEVKAGYRRGIIRSLVPFAAVVITQLVMSSGLGIVTICTGWLDTAVSSIVGAAKGNANYGWVNGLSVILEGQLLRGTYLNYVFVYTIVSGILRIIVNLVDLNKSIIVGPINRVLGGIAGFAGALIEIWVICTLLYYLSCVIPEQTNVITSNMWYLSSWFYNHNPIIRILTILNPLGSAADIYEMFR